MGHPYGTSTLTEIDSLTNLVQYLRNTYAQTSNTYEIYVETIILELTSTQMKFIIFVLAKNVVRYLLMLYAFPLQSLVTIGTSQTV